MNAPIVSTTSTGPYGLTISLVRYGKVVRYSFSGFPTSTMASEGTSDETIPAAYRPTATAMAPFRTSYNGTTVGVGRVYTNGTFGWWLPNSADTGTDCTFSTTYFTNADWPE